MPISPAQQVRAVAEPAVPNSRWLTIPVFLRAQYVLAHSHMKDNSQRPLLPLLQGTACIVIILWGARASIRISSGLCCSVYCLPMLWPHFPNGSCTDSRSRKLGRQGSSAVTLSVTGLIVVSALELGVAGLTMRLPIYGQHLAGSLRTGNDLLELLMALSQRVWPLQECAYT